MKTLNLVDLDKSDIKYKILSFPDGQQDIIITGYSTGGYNGDLDYLKQCCHTIQIKSRFNSWKDLELICCANQALRRLKIKEIHLYIPYLLGARSDRQFVEGGTSYLVDVLAPVINSQEFSSVTMMDCHSDVGVGLIRNSKNISNVRLVQWALTQIDNTKEAQNNTAIVSPDGGALKKIYDTTLGAKLKCDIILSAKHRDVKTGKLNGFDVPIKESQIEKSLVWIDDICSGGGTFIGEAQKADEMGHKGKKYLIVTHYENTSNIENLKKHFSKIFTTDSYCSIEDNDFIKQLNVF